jgi:leucyl aminopeptidase (aminopeptidase T)
MTSKTEGAEKIVRICAGIQPGEKVLVIAEPRMLAVAAHISAAVQNAGAACVDITIPPREYDGQEPPAPVAAAMSASDVFLSCVYTSITHTHAVKAAVAAGARGLVLTHWNEGMLATGGIDADFDAIAPVCRAVAAKLANATEVILTTPQGTNLRFSASGRRGNALVGVVAPGEFSTLPTIEANVSPLEGTAEGLIVADASIPYLGIGVLNEPVTLEVSKGYVTSVTGGPQAEQFKTHLENQHDPECFNVAELGVGLNPCCHFTGFMLEDEGVEGSVHIGIGTSITLGGTIKAATHYDVIMTGATLLADGMPILVNGERGLT